MSDQQAEMKDAEAFKNQGGLGSFLANILVVVGISFIVSVGVVTFVRSHDQAAPKFVLVNTESLVREEIEILGEKVRNGEIPSENMPVKSKAFSGALLDEINQYVQKGYVVLRSEVVIDAPDDVQDITAPLKETLQAKGLMEKPYKKVNKGSDEGG